MKIGNFTVGNYEKEAGNTKTEADAAEQTDSTTEGINRVDY